MVGKSEFLKGILVSNTRYEQPENRNTNLFHLFKDHLDCALAHYLVKLKTTKHNIDKFLSNLLIKPITKKLSYCNTDKWIEKLSTIS